MNNPTGISHRLIRTTAALALTGIITAWAINAGGAPFADRYAIARKVARGDARMMPMTGSLAPEPQPWPSDTILPNTKHWFLPTARAGHESPNANTKTSRLKPIHMRQTILATEYATDTHGVQPYPDLPPMSPLVWASFPDPSELSVPIILSGPDGDDAKLSSDPTSVQSRFSALAEQPPLRQKHVAFLRLTIPDPFALVEAVKFEPHAMPPDNDPPALPKTPPDPTMPITPRK